MPPPPPVPARTAASPASALPGRGCRPAPVDAGLRRAGRSMPANAASSRCPGGSLLPSNCRAHGGSAGNRPAAARPSPQAATTAPPLPATPAGNLSCRVTTVLIAWPGRGGAGCLGIGGAPSSSGPVLPDPPMRPILQTFRSGRRSRDVLRSECRGRSWATGSGRPMTTRRHRPVPNGPDGCGISRGLPWQRRRAPAGASR
jgi:hypothetical protein